MIKRSKNLARTSTRQDALNAFGIGEARPFLKWAGGKSQLLDVIDSALPSALKAGGIDTYIEPFVGGGAVFFWIASRYDLKRFVLSDINRELILCYLAVRDRVEDVIKELSAIEREYKSTRTESEREGYYYRKRDEFNDEVQAHLPKSVSSEQISHVARLIFLNRTCFNGLFRVNKSNKFNVPFGRYSNPLICNEVNIRAASKVLQKADLICAEFDTLSEFAGPRSLFYFDPPYRPISETSAFKSYAASDFNDVAQKRLAGYTRELSKGGTLFLLSNSDPRNGNPDDDFFDNLYSGFEIMRVDATRMINSVASKRGVIKELLIRNYQTGT